MKWFATVVVLPIAAATAWLSATAATHSATPAEREAATHREIRRHVVVPASRADVWRAWTTVAGAQTFFAPAAVIELRPGGPFELYFLPDAPPGDRGSEGATIVAFRERDFLAFTWNAPTTMPAVRAQHTLVVVQLHAAEDGATAASDAATDVELLHTGWGTGPEWDEAYAYFARAWDVVLQRLVGSFIDGPVNWQAPG